MITRRAVELFVLDYLTRKIHQDVELKDRINEDLGQDSLDEIEIVMDCEREYNLCISDEIIASYTDMTAGNLVDIICEQLKIE